MWYKSGSDLKKRRLSRLSECSESSKFSEQVSVEKIEEVDENVDSDTFDKFAEYIASIALNSAICSSKLLTPDSTDEGFEEKTEPPVEADIIAQKTKARLRWKKAVNFLSIVTILTKVRCPEYVSQLFL